MQVRFISGLYIVDECAHNWFNGTFYVTEECIKARMPDDENKVVYFLGRFNEGL